jgi:hypothetical protein
MLVSPPPPQKRERKAPALTPLKVGEYQFEKVVFHIPWNNSKIPRTPLGRRLKIELWLQIGVI